jgi:hypothetical protein
VKYLKKYYRTNEDKLDLDLSFDDFKDLMYDVVDNFKYTFEHSINDKEEFYDCYIYLPSLFEPIGPKSYVYQYLNIVLGDQSEIGNIEEYNKLDIENNIEKEIEGIKNYILFLNKRLDINENKIKPIFENLRNNIIPRFFYFNNCKSCSIGVNYYEDEGMDMGEIRITFDINNWYDLAWKNHKKD